MADPVARKRLKKKMLDRWENEGGRIAADTTADDIRPIRNDKGQDKKLTPRDNSTVRAPASSTKSRKPTRK
ncbi:MAG TPA: hypothetical protein VFD63_09985 [Pyrinomonadaceae bacterium]|nr:hypothetical protein [Pyrinomonadaceae bacterium]